MHSLLSGEDGFAYGEEHNWIDEVVFEGHDEYARLAFMHFFDEVSLLGI
ncbi:MAG TPA: hypothetical protein VKX41_21515 [Alloacidobacterium sp.]|jgi:hypothetical protein|nr:hypothetical protein [Alloacidobacterium sp.]